MIQTFLNRLHNTIQFNLYFKQITNGVEYDDYHYSDFRLRL